MKNEYYKSLFSDLMIEKSKTLPADSEYRDVYEILAKLLKGESFNLEKINNQTLTILMILIEDLNKITCEIASEDFFEENNVNNPTSTSNNDNINNNLLAELRTLFRIRKIEEMTNPISISTHTNETIFNKIFKD